MIKPETQPEPVQVTDTEILHPRISDEEQMKINANRLLAMPIGRIAIALLDYGAGKPKNHG